MDIEDGLYLFAAILIGIGVGTASVGAGIAAFGAMLAFPPMLNMLRGGKGGSK